MLRDFYFFSFPANVQTLILIVRLVTVICLMLPQWTLTLRKNKKRVMTGAHAHTHTHIHIQVHVHSVLHEYNLPTHCMQVW